jgi:hypothetical protein
MPDAGAIQEAGETPALIRPRPKPTTGRARGALVRNVGGDDAECPGARKAMGGLATAREPVAVSAAASGRK